MVSHSQRDFELRDPGITDGDLMIHVVSIHGLFGPTLCFSCVNIALLDNIFVFAIICYFRFWCVNFVYQICCLSRALYFPFGVLILFTRYAVFIFVFHFAHVTVRFTLFLVGKCLLRYHLTTKQSDEFI